MFGHGPLRLIQTPKVDFEVRQGFTVPAMQCDVCVTYFPNRESGFGGRGWVQGHTHYFQPGDRILRPI